MPKQRDPDLDMLTLIELRLRQNQEELLTLTGAAVAIALCPGHDEYEVRYGVTDIARIMLAYNIERRFDLDTSEWVLTLHRKPEPNQPEATSTQEKHT